MKVPSAIVAFCDNISSVYMSRNPVHHRRTKHIELDIHFVREKVAIGELRVTHVPSARQLVDVFTKGLPSTLFFEFRDSLSITAGDVETAGGVSGTKSSTAEASQTSRIDDGSNSSRVLHAHAAPVTRSSRPRVPGLRAPRMPARHARPLECTVMAKGPRL